MSAAASSKPHKSKSHKKGAAAASSSPALPPARPPRLTASHTPDVPLHAAPPASLATLPRYLHPLHRCRFVALSPHSIISLAFSPSGSLLAVGRSNGNIELWRVGYN